jgi:hypothetical protein
MLNTDTPTSTYEQGAFAGTVTNLQQQIIALKNENLYLLKQLNDVSSSLSMATQENAAYRSQLYNASSNSNLKSGEVLLSEVGSTTDTSSSKSTSKSKKTLVNE